MHNRNPGGWSIVWEEGNLMQAWWARTIFSAFILYAKLEKFKKSLSIAATRPTTRRMNAGGGAANSQRKERLNFSVQFRSIIKTMVYFLSSLRLASASTTPIEQSNQLDGAWAEFVHRKSAFQMPYAKPYRDAIWISICAELAGLLRNTPHAITRSSHATSL